MASYYAQLDDNNIVISIVAVSDASVFNPDGSDNEAAGIAFCKTLYGPSTNWLHTCYDGRLRKNYAGIGGSYDPVKDAFIPIQPYSKWLLNDACQWVSPAPYPTDGKLYYWDDLSSTWKIQ